MTTTELKAMEQGMPDQRIADITLSHTTKLEAINREKIDVKEKVAKMQAACQSFRSRLVCVVRGDTQ